MTTKPWTVMDPICAMTVVVATAGSSTSDGFVLASRYRTRSGGVKPRRGTPKVGANRRAADATRMLPEGAIMVMAGGET